MCNAIRVNDEMQCGRCGLAWDVKDPDPPECLTQQYEQSVDIGGVVFRATYEHKPGTPVVVTGLREYDSKTPLPGQMVDRCRLLFVDQLTAHKEGVWTP